MGVAKPGVAMANLTGWGLLCGLFAILSAIAARNRLMARLAVILALVAVSLSGPAIGLTLLFGWMSGLGGLLDLAFSWGEPGMEGVGIQSIGQLAIGVISTLGFVSQAWAIRRALRASC